MRIGVPSAFQDSAARVPISWFLFQFRSHFAHPAGLSPDLDRGAASRTLSDVRIVGEVTANRRIRKADGSDRKAAAMLKCTGTVVGASISVTLRTRGDLLGTVNCRGGRWRRSLRVLFVEQRS